jgi:transcriptional regulator with XRE-family HTH domain
MRICVASETMPASKRAHVLSVLRENLRLSQSELAGMVGVTASTIQSIELNRLALSKLLAARISGMTGVDLDWLLKNDLSAPMPEIVNEYEKLDPSIRAHDATIALLGEVFDRLFAAVGRIEKTQARTMLEISIASALDSLRKQTSVNDRVGFGFRTGDITFKFFREHPNKLDPDLRKVLNLDEMAKEFRGIPPARRPRKSKEQSPKKPSRPPA